jgi:bifunctional DNA-binding transcriptional regulator/antitoxin component of YhaV-PrlF toxin-antitoxin module
MEDGSYHVTLSGGRRLVLPRVVCDELHVDVGDRLLLRVENGRVSLQSVSAAVEHFRAKLRDKIGTERSLVAELIAEREAESSRE